MRSGSAAKSFTPYSYAKDLEFLRCILEMRSTDTCWDDEPAEEDSAPTQEPPKPGSPNQQMAEITGEEEQEEGGLLHQCTTGAQLKGGVPNGQMKKSEKMYTLLKDVSDHFTGQLSLSQQFANTLVPYFDQVPNA
ncbi:hypothetical protein AB205_0152310 [Aquarana catesbeiana]|uniref:Uncharacterized protein n=1 Tax=Aquarana catesbeiana TaxID=8400 RepID=A0A2G9QG79_AQUCT|nr:hypothetical protein AB205_0152310 [Aquarana catesbeiana]